MATTPKTPKLIKPSLTFGKLLDADFLTRVKAIEAGMTGNPAYPSPPVSMPVFTAAGDAYSAAIATALDGSKTAIAARHKQRAAVMAMIHLLGPYVQSSCNNDLTTLLSSGFTVATRVTVPPQPLAPPTIVSVNQGATGQLLVTIKPLAKARSYELRYAVLGAGGTPGAYTSTTVATAKQVDPISGLTPGTIYAFQARAFGKLGFSDWGTAVERMVI
jgi:hypothetical protein